MCLHMLCLTLGRRFEPPEGAVMYTTCCSECIIFICVCRENRTVLLPDFSEKSWIKILRFNLQRSLHKVK